MTRIFTLTPGRTGSTTLIRAFSHSNVYSVGQQTNWGKTGSRRLDYPDRHVESDARLFFFANELSDRFDAEDTHWVVMRRPLQEIVDSYARRRGRSGIVYTFGIGVLGMSEIRSDDQWEAVARTFVVTAYSIIDAFIESRSNVHEFSLGQAKDDFAKLWDTVGAGSGLEEALREWNIAHNASKTRAPRRRKFLRP